MTNQPDTIQKATVGKLDGVEVVIINDVWVFDTKTGEWNMILPVSQDSLRKAEADFKRLFRDEGVFFNAPHQAFARFCHEHRETILTSIKFLQEKFIK